MKIKTSELIGPALDWATWTAVGGADRYPKTASGKAFLKLWKGNSAKYIHPSTLWSQGGPIIERKGITIRRVHDGTWRADFPEAVLKPDGSAYAYLQEKGPTPLVAAMRCCVASQLGDEVDIPEELIEV